MRIFAINGSPDGEKGNTDLILQKFLQGAKDAGAEVEVFYTKRLKIAPCHGGSCLHCWTKHPRVCRQKDSMNDLYSKLQEADVWVFATPVFVDGMSGPLKMFIDRIIPIVEPFIELRNGHCRHIIPEATKRGKIVLVSTAGFPELDNFDPLVAHIKAICKNAGREYAGALLRPAGPALKFPTVLTVGLGLKKRAILNSAKDAGKELAESGKISEKTQERVSAELIHTAMYRRILNWSFERQHKQKK